ncbi:MAG: hypothetical protein AB7S75_12915 [Desulfococcaceae bacterium]
MKKIIIMLAICSFFSFISLPKAQAKILGDVNYDSKIDLAEAIYALQILAGIKNVPSQSEFEGIWDTPSQGRNTSSLKNTRYIFNVTSESKNVDIELIGLGVDEYLYVIDNFGNTIVSSDNGISSNSLLPGTYTIIPTTYDSGVTGNYTLSITGPVADIRTVSSPHITKKDSISVSGGRNHNSPKNVFYSFELSEKKRVELQLQGTGFDEYIYLLDSFNNIISEADSGYILYDLDPGQYKIVVTTYSPNITGGYILDIWGDISDLQKFTYPHFETNGSVTSSGGRDPSSTNNPHYNFDVDKTGYVQIEYQGTGYDNYLYLLDNLNGIISESDSGNFLGILEPGTYTIVAATYSSGITGGFTIDIWGSVSNFP